jgi:hypothetical protein
MVLARMAEMFWYPPGTAVDGDTETDVSGNDGASSGVGVMFDEDEGGDPSERTTGGVDVEEAVEIPLAFCCWVRRAWMRMRT